MDATTSLALATSTVATLKSYLTVTIPQLYPFAIGMAVLFGGYALIKGWYHRHL